MTTNVRRYKTSFPLAAYDKLRSYHSESCCPCLENWFRTKHTCKLHPFPLAGPLEFVTIDIWGLVPRLASGPQHVVTVTVGYSKLTRADPTQPISWAPLATIFFDKLVLPYVILNFELAGNVPEFVRNFFKTFKHSLVVRNLMNTPSHSLMSGQVERYNCILVDRLRNYVSRHHIYLDANVQPLTNAYNMQTHIATVTYSSNGILPSKLPSAATFHKLIDPTNDMKWHVTLRSIPHLFLQQIDFMRSTGGNRLSATLWRFEHYFDKNVWRERTFKVGHYEFVDCFRLPGVA